MSLLLLKKATANLLKLKHGKNYFQIVKISDHERNMIGRREVVGYGHNGQPTYVDRSDFPFPAIRWKEPTAEIEALREKEKGDWNELSCEEKKNLYRASFCQTFSEFNASNSGEWKSMVAILIFHIVAGLWLSYWFKITIYKHDPLPGSFDEESRRQQFRRLLDLKTNPIQGLASKWDYERDDWKNPNDPWKSKNIFESHRD
ncbi:unnamed protein product [Ceutorhynchus assimilis]|uniref:Cytochrome c oxidase subunit 4 n=1 Tax=Ceutorhynchus assimilis TaxID=467358 RepID=A0A9N9MG91_9CUCU|nr:unnamed protein product [Ceutorhynchus assimilis]